MDELLGLYGYDKVESDEGIELSSSLTQSKIPITGSVTKPNQKTNQGHKSPIGKSLDTLPLPLFRLTSTLGKGSHLPLPLSQLPSILSKVSHHAFNS